MKAEYSTIPIEGDNVQRVILHPEAHTRTVAACIFTHGQGDYAERYLHVLHPFTEAGIRCIITDLPGHGRSTGKRGHIKSQDCIDAIIQSNLEIASGLPTGIAGHSMGGLLTLRHLSLSLQGFLPIPAFCWINSPLLSPGNNRPQWFIHAARLLARFTPKTTIHTGATADKCRPAESADTPLTKDSAKLGHQRVSLAWGLELLKIAEHTLPALEKNSFSNPLLFTQGGLDSICPAHITQAFFEQLHGAQKSYKEFPSMLHETFAGLESEQLFQHLSQWIHSSVLKSLPPL